MGTTRRSCVDDANVPIYCEGCGKTLTFDDWPFGYRVVQYLCDGCKALAEEIISTPERTHESPGNDGS